MKNISYIELNFIYNVLKCLGLHDYMKKNIEKWLIKKKYLMLTPKKFLLGIFFHKILIAGCSIKCSIKCKKPIFKIFDSFWVISEKLVNIFFY